MCLTWISSKRQISSHENTEYVLENQHKSRVKHRKAASSLVVITHPLSLPFSSSLFPLARRFEFLLFFWCRIGVFCPIPFFPFLQIPYSLHPSMHA